MSPQNIDEYKRRLLSIRARLTGQLDRMVEAVREDIRASGNLSNLPLHPGDQATEGLDAEVDVIQNETAILEEVENALVRIEDETYGGCQNCGEEIAAERLEALPYTPYCIGCASLLEQQPM